MPETAQLDVRIDLKGNLSSGITKAQGQLNGLSKSVGRVGKGVGQIGAGFARAGLLVGGAAVAGLTAAAKAGIDFEDAFAGVIKTVDSADLAKAGMTFEGLAKTFREMATRIPITAVEFARIGEAAGALGVKVSDIDDFTETVAMLGVTTDLTADTAADALGRIGTILKFTGDDYRNFADSLVALGNAGASVESEIVEIAKRFAAEGKAAGLATSDIAGLASATASLGFAPERGGTALARVFANMGTNIALANDEGKQFSKTTGRSIKDLQNSLNRGEGLGIFTDFLEGLQGLSATDAAKVLKAAGITNTSDRTIFRVMADNLPFVNKQLEIAKNATGALLEEATKKFATTASSIQIFKNNVIEAALTLSDGFLPAVTRALDKLSAAFKDPANKGEIKKLGEDIGKALDDIDWAEVMAGAREFVGVLKSTLAITLSILEQLNKLPTQFKAAAAGFLVLSKASGGLLAAGAGNIVGGVLETAARGLGSKIPKVGSLFAQPVFVTNWPMGGLGGGPGGAAGGRGNIIGALGIAGIIIAAAVPIGEAFADALPASWKGPDGKGRSESQTRIENARLTITNARLPNITGPSDRQHEGAGFRPKPATAVPFFRPDKADAIKSGIDSTTTAVETMKGNLGKDIGLVHTATGDVKTATIAAGVLAKNATTLTGYQTQGSVRSSGASIVGAIKANRPIITVNVSATTVSRTINVTNRYGSPSGSRSSDSQYGSVPT